MSIHNSDKLNLPANSKKTFKYNLANQKVETNGMIIKKHEELRKKTIEKKKKEKQSSQYKTKMMEIARRIAKGDKVPPEDECRLREFNQQLYLMVKSLALMKKNPEKYDSLFGKDRQDSVSIDKEEENSSLEDTMDEIMSENVE